MRRCRTALPRLIRTLFPIQMTSFAAWPTAAIASARPHQCASVLVPIGTFTCGLAPFRAHAATATSSPGSGRTLPVARCTLVTPGLAEGSRSTRPVDPPLPHLHSNQTATRPCAMLPDAEEWAAESGRVSLIPVWHVWSTSRAVAGTPHRPRWPRATDERDEGGLGPSRNASLGPRRNEQAVLRIWPAGSIARVRWAVRASTTRRTSGCPYIRPGRGELMLTIQQRNRIVPRLWA
jgi:hypothetical protein